MGLFALPVADGIYVIYGQTKTIRSTMTDKKFVYSCIRIIMVVFLYIQAIKMHVEFDKCPDGWTTEEGRYCTISIINLDNDITKGKVICEDEFHGKSIYSGSIDVDQKVEKATRDLLCQVSIGPNFDLMLDEDFNVSDPDKLKAYILKHDNSKSILP